MDTDEDTDEEHEDAPLVASDEQSRREARLRHEPTVWSDDPLANVTLVLLLLLALGGGILTGFYGFDVLMRLASLVRCATPSSPARVAAEPARAAAATIKRPAESADSPVGHEWYGGAVGGSEGAGHDERWGPAQQEPRNGSLLVLGILSGSRNFEERDWLRRAFWKQRAARQGVEWRFVVGTQLPSGDNNRVSLMYERAKYLDIDVVPGSELPPTQALKALGWLLEQADQLSRGGRGPAFVGLSSDAVLLSLPRLASMLRPLGTWAKGGARARLPSRHVYGGALRWATIPLALEHAPPSRPGGQAQASGWRCLRETTPAALLHSRLAGDSAAGAAAAGAAAGGAGGAGAARAPAAGGRAALEARAKTARSCAGAGASPPSTFLAAGPELAILGSSLLTAIRAELAALLQPSRAGQLHAEPQPSRWKRSEAFHMAADGRTPAEPALVAATALAALVERAAEAGRVSLALAHLDLQPHSFSWDEDAGPLAADARTAVVSGLKDALEAEVGVGVLAHQRAPSPPLQCSAARCAQWGERGGEAAARLCCAF